MLDETRVTASRSGVDGGWDRVGVGVETAGEYTAEFCEPKRGGQRWSGVGIGEREGT